MPERVSTSSENVLDAIIAALKEKRAGFKDSEISRNQVRFELQQLRSALAIVKGSKDVASAVEINLAKGNFEGAESSMLAAMAKSTAAVSYDDVLAISSALKALYRLEGSPAKLVSLERIYIEAKTAQQALATTSSQSKGPTNSTQNQAQVAAPATPTITPSPILIPAASPPLSSSAPAISPLPPESSPPPPFEITSQSANQFTVSQPMKRIEITFSGVN